MKEKRHYHCFPHNTQIQATVSIEAQKQYEKVMKTDGNKPVRIEEKPKSAYIKRKEKEKKKRF